MTYLEKKFGRNRKQESPAVHVSHVLPGRELPHEAVQRESEAAQRRVAENASQEMRDAFLALGILDKDQIDTAITAYQDNPAVRSSVKSAVGEMLSQYRNGDLDSFAEKLSRDAQLVFEASLSGEDVVSEDNILIPYLRAHGLISEEISHNTTSQTLKNAAAPKRLSISPTGYVKLAVGHTAKPAALAVNLVLGVIDYSAGAQAGAAALTDMGASEGVVKYGSALGSAAVNGLLLARKTQVEGRPGYITPWVLGVGDLFWGKTTGAKIGGVLFAAGLAAMAPAIYGQVKRSSVDAAVSGEVGEKMKAQYQPEVEKVRAEIARAQNLFTELNPLLETQMQRAFVSGGIGWGPRTWAQSRVLFGETQKNEENFASFTRDPKGVLPHPPSYAQDRTPQQIPPQIDTAIRTAEEDLAIARKIKDKKERRKAVREAEEKLSALKQKNSPGRMGTKSLTEESNTPAPAPEAVRTAIRDVNVRYGLTEADGAEQLLKKLTNEIKSIKPESAFAALEGLIQESQELSGSGLGKQMIGSVASLPHIFGVLIDNIRVEGLTMKSTYTDVPWDELAHSAAGIRAIFASEKRYLTERSIVAEKLKNVTITTTLQQYLSEIHAATGVDARINIPEITFNLPVEATGIEKEPYRVMIEKSLGDHIEIPADDSPEWQHIARTFEQSGISIDVSTPEGKRLAIALLFSLIITMLAGGVFASIAGKKVHRLWVIEGPLKEDERRALSATEGKITTDMIRILRERERSLSESIATLSGKTPRGVQERTDESLEMILQRKLRSFILSTMNPPMHETPAGKAFIDKKTHIGNRPLRDMYVRTLNAFLTQYESNPSEGLIRLLNSVHTEHVEEIEALHAFVKASHENATPTALQMNIASWYEKIDTKLRDEEIAARESAIQDLYMQRRAFTQISPLPNITLTENTPEDTITPGDIIRTEKVSDIDFALAVHHQTIKDLSRGTRVGTILDSGTEMSEEQRRALNESVRAEELSNTVRGLDASEVAREYSTLIHSLAKRTPALKEAVKTVFGDDANRDTISFAYTYDPNIRACTVTASLPTQAGEILTLSLGEEAPSSTLSSDTAIISKFREKLSPGSPDMQYIKYRAVHNNTVSEIERITKEIESELGAHRVTSLTEETRADLNDLLFRKSVAAIQDTILRSVQSGRNLTQVEIDLFENPKASRLSSVWRGDVQTIMSDVARKYPTASIAYDITSAEIVVSSDVERRIPLL